MQPLSLYQLNALVRDAVEQTFPDTLWVVGELSEARQAGNGHFYGEIIEKDTDGRNVLARARIHCWARQYNILRLRFMQESGQELRAGLRVLLQVQLMFHEAYGYSLNITDIDASYTLGSLAQQRREILRRLDEDGILHDNQSLPLPPLTQRIAVVSASTAAGYGDFCHHLQHNPYHFRFSVQLFPAVMQGQYVEESILSALQQIADEADEWDVVVIIRGGGAVADLACFDTYHLAAAVAQFPLPVIVGIGHERDETVLDYVAHKFVKTPTAAADFIIVNQTAQLTALDRFSARIHDAATLALRNRQDKLRNLTARMPLAVLKYTFRCNHRLQLMSRALSAGASSALVNAAHDADRLSQRLHTAVPLMLERRQHSLDLLAQKVAQNDPLRILRQGYSITTVRGRVVTDAAQIQPGDKIHTRLAQGEIVSECQEKNTTTSE